MGPVESAQTLFFYGAGLPVKNWSKEESNKEARGGMGRGKGRREGEEGRGGGKGRRERERKRRARRRGEEGGREGKK